MKFCVVDDSSFQRNQLQKMIEGLGHEVESMKNGLEALEVLKDKTFDCIITDLLMPGLDGLGLTKEIRNRNIVTPIVILSADIQQVVKNECLQNGANAFLNKPANEEKLRSVFELVQTGKAI